ncbi:LysR family transcriptional regulator [Micromonospora sp. WMMD712]|uniref:LysR family transcriptional regulator n=1 Tax=Micromonospora TaxID=1873 RepID=UPI00249C32EC|nr:LysR family transcriptional regulator [Micromonospora sp. WMMD712]WFE60126.1 LysR family transcriptional regulator [Micromonospora sp. WMMD712]
MELRNLRAFETVARTLSVTQAAKELHYAQSSISDQIQSLERELGVELLDRSQRRLRLTPQGAVLSEYTDRILKLLEEARFAVSRPGTELAVGALETVSVHLLPPVLAAYRDQNPQMRVRLGHDNRGQLYKAVRRGDLDLCLTFGSPPPDTSLRSETLAEEPLVIIVPPAHPLAERGRAGLAELAREAFLATEQGCGFREMFEGVFGAGTKEPVAEVSSIGTLGACVAAGMGCALLPMLSVRHQVARGEVAVVQSEDTDLRTTLTMTWLDRNSANPGLVSFQSMLRTHLSG